jgi:hypothetical protein
MSKSQSKSHLAKLSLVLAILGLAAAAPAAYAESQEDMARDLVPSQKPMYQLGHGGGDHAVDAWVDNPDLVYRIGQHLKVYVRPKQTSYITVLNVGSSGRVSVIFPNYYQREAKVYAGQTVAIPADTAGWRIDVAGPPGVEVIKIIATRERLDLAELKRLGDSSADSPILSLDRSADAVARDLVPQLKQPSGGGLGLGGVKNLLVRVLPRGASLQAPPFAGQKLGEAFGLTLRPERPIYKIGDSVRVAMAVKHDCQLSLVSVGTSGRAVRLFPNKHQPYGVLRAGQTVIVPSPNAPIEFKAEGPAGVEGLMATCRSVGGSSPSSEGAGDFAAVDGLKGLTRDLVAAPTAGDEPVEYVSSSFIVWNWPAIYERVRPLVDAAVLSLKSHRPQHPRARPHAQGPIARRKADRGDRRRSARRRIDGRCRRSGARHERDANRREDERDREQDAAAARR